MHPLTHYLEQIRTSHGPGVAESSTYGALETLFNAVGETLDLPVVCVMQLKDTGAGIPDGGLFTEGNYVSSATMTSNTVKMLTGSPGITAPVSPSWM